MTRDVEIQFVTFRDVVLTIKSKLLGADLVEAAKWLQKYIHPNRLMRRNSYISGIPPLIFFDENKRVCVEQHEMKGELLSMIIGFPVLFNERCYSTYGFDKNRLISFFKNHKIDIDFPITDSPIGMMTLADEKEDSKDEIIEELRKEIDLLRKANELNSKDDILFLNNFRQDDPLALAIEIRNKEWVGYNPDDKSTEVIKRVS
ncbi:hypothetical protein [Photorhabdus temperata]|uniref:Uncharacterized protein n=1 Tax=Photorhabdus temperata J3 TaxID=1389415 RepID=U7QXY5_PHOTE|nr:hypothetical protein [Photorhabdus temperata]ERT11897.1 hypothetical protein O185_17070 [Photorhabdus temperata J3]